MDLKLSDHLTTKNTTLLCAQSSRDNTIRTGKCELTEGLGEHRELPPESRGCICPEERLRVRNLERGKKDTFLYRNAVCPGQVLERVRMGFPKGPNMKI